MSKKYSTQKAQRFEDVPFDSSKEGLVNTTIALFALKLESLGVERNVITSICNSVSKDVCALMDSVKGPSDE